MNFDAGSWWLVTTLAGAVVATIGYFLKRTMTEVDRQRRDIGEIQQSYVTAGRISGLDKDINHIKQTYVTKDEFKDQRAEFRAELAKISDTVDDIKENCLSKADFYRAQADTNESIKRIYDLLIKMERRQGE